MSKFYKAIKCVISMKRALVLFVSIFLLINTEFGFDILNSEDEEKTYFSINDPDVFVKSTIEFENFTVYYTLVNTSESKVYDFFTCDTSFFCGNFTLTSLIETSNDTFTGSNIFTITRKTRGDDIDAACGQLVGKVMAKAARHQKGQVGLN